MRLAQCSFIEAAPTFLSVPRTLNLLKAKM